VICVFITTFLQNLSVTDGSQATWCFAADRLSSVSKDAFSLMRIPRGISSKDLPPKRSLFAACHDFAEIFPGARIVFWDNGWKRGASPLDFEPEGFLILIRSLRLRIAQKMRAHSQRSKDSPDDMSSEILEHLSSSTLAELILKGFINARLFRQAWANEERTLLVSASGQTEGS
jgi:hypothetical protein